MWGMEEEFGEGEGVERVKKCLILIYEILKI